MFASKEKMLRAVIFYRCRSKKILLTTNNDAVEQCSQNGIAWEELNVAGQFVKLKS